MQPPSPSAPSMHGLGFPVSPTSRAYFDDAAGRRSRHIDPAVRSSKHYVPGASHARTDPLQVTGDALEVYSPAPQKPLRKAVESMSFKASLTGTLVRPGTAEASSRREVAFGTAAHDQSLATTTSRLFGGSAPSGGAPATPGRGYSASPAQGVTIPPGYTPSPGAAVKRTESIATHIARPASHPDVLQYRYHTPAAAAHKFESARPATPVTSSTEKGACRQSFVAATTDYYRNLHHAKSSNVFY